MCIDAPSIGTVINGPVCNCNILFTANHDATEIGVWPWLISVLDNGQPGGVCRWSRSSVSKKLFLGNPNEVGMCTKAVKPYYILLSYNGRGIERSHAF